MNMNFLIKRIKFPSAEGQAKDWQRIDLFNRRIGSFDNFSSHTSTLKPNTLPHKFHSHMEEELILCVCGNVEILTRDMLESKPHDCQRLEPGSFVYHSPGQFHTLRSGSTATVQYLIFKWQWACSHALINHGTYSLDGDAWGKPFFEQSSGFRLLSIDGLYDHTSGTLRAHYSCLEPCAGYKAHRDKHDIIAVLLEGELEIFNIPITAPAFLFFAAGTPHGFFNPGTLTTRYIVFEFYNQYFN